MKVPKITKKPPYLALFGVGLENWLHQATVLWETYCFSIAQSSPFPVIGQAISPLQILKHQDFTELSMITISIWACKWEWEVYPYWYTLKQQLSCLSRIAERKYSSWQGRGHLPEAVALGAELPPVHVQLALPALAPDRDRGPGLCQPSAPPAIGAQGMAGAFHNRG